MVRGELAIQVQCEKRKVKHLLQKQNTCYESLPVQSDGSNETQELFMEPISRVLRKGSRRLPCSKARHGFQARDGRFYRASPMLALVEKPTKSILGLNLRADSSTASYNYRDWTTC